MNNRKGSIELDVLIPLGLVIGFISAEFFVFYNPEARSDWTRMMPCAITAPFTFGIACLGAVMGLIGLTKIPDCIYRLATGSENIELIGPFICAGIGLFGGGGTIYRWVKYIIIDNCPAFGYNPDNVYAVVGINSMFLLPIMAIVGAIGGAIVYWILRIIISITRKIFC